MSIQNTVSTWEEVLETARKNTSARRVKRTGQSPSTAPIPSSLQKLPPNTEPPVLLYRDTNSWCPFCERVWFALEEKEIPFQYLCQFTRVQRQWKRDEYVLKQ